MRDIAKWFLLLVLGLLVSQPSTASAQISSLQSSPFILPAGLEPAVDFWKKVFSEISLSQLIYFDPSDMSKIYEVVDVGEENRSNDYINGERARIAAAQWRRYRAGQSAARREGKNRRRHQTLGSLHFPDQANFQRPRFATGAHLSADRGIVLRY